MKRAKLDNKKAIGYIRVSTDQQQLGPEAQQHTIEQYAQKNNLELLITHRDIGISGTAPAKERPGLTDALASMGSLRAGTLLVARRDRIAREVSIASAVDRAVLFAGGRVISADGVANGDTHADAFLRTILDASAQYERDLNADRTSKALGVLRRSGKRFSRYAPWGFQYENGLLVPNHSERTAIKVARELATLNTLRVVCDCLTKAGFTARGKPFTKAIVFRMLRAEF